MAPPPSSAFVPPIVPPPRLPGGAAAPTVVPASAFTSGSGAAVTAATSSAGDRKTTAPSRGRSRRKTVASTGRPTSKRTSSLSRGGGGGGGSSSGGGADAVAGSGEKTSTVVRAPAHRTSASGGGRHAAGVEQPPTAAAVADVLSALVELLSPATAPGAGFETEASSAAKIPPQPVTLAQMMSPTPGQSPLEAAATMLASTAEAAPSGKAAVEVPKGARAPPRSAPTVTPPKVFTLPEMLAPTPAQSPLEAAATLLAAAAEAAPSGKAATEVPSPVKPLLSPPTGESPLDVAASRLAPAPVQETKSAEEPPKATFLVPCTGPTAMPSLADVLDVSPARSPLEVAASKLDSLAQQAPSGKAAFEPPPHVRALLTPTPGESPLERTAEAMYTPPAVKAPVEVSVPSGPPTMEQLLAPPPARTPLEAAATVLQRSAELHPSGKAAMESQAHMATLLHPTPSLESPLERTAEAMYTPPVVDAPVDKDAVSNGPLTVEQLLARPVAPSPLEASAAVLERSAELHPSGRAAMASPADMKELMNPKPFMESPLERTAEAMYTAPEEEESSLKKLLVPSSSVALTPLQASATVLQRSAELSSSGMAAMASPVHMQELMNPKPSMDSPVERIAESMYIAPVADEPVVDMVAASLESPTMEELLAPPTARTPLEAAASVLQRSAELSPTGKAATASPAQLDALMHPAPSMDSPLERAAEAMYTAPAEVKPVVEEVAAPAGRPTMAELLSPPAARTPLEAVASKLQRSAEKAPTGKAAMKSPNHMAELMNPTPSTDSPLERVAEAMYTSPVVQTSVVKPSTAPAPMPTIKQLLSPPPADTPLEAAATMLQRFAELDPSGKAAMASPARIETLLFPKPSMESPLEQTAEGLFPAPAEEAPVAAPFVPKLRTPLQASAAMLERAAVLDPSGKAAMSPPADMAALLHPEPSMESPLERIAESMYTAPEVAPPTKVFSPKMRTPLQASAVVLERSALLNSSGKAAMAPPPNMAALLHPAPSMESPLERTAEAMYTAPAVKTTIKSGAAPVGSPTMAQLLSPPAASTPLEAAASVLQRSAELHPSGKAAMASPMHMRELMNPKPSMKSPLERTAEAMYTAPVVEAPATVVKPTGLAPMPTIKQLLAPPAARSPLVAAATVLQRSAELAPSGKAAMESPTRMEMLMHPEPSMDSPLERRAEAMYTAPKVEEPVREAAVTSTGPTTMKELLAASPARTPLEVAASVLQASAQLHPSGKAAMFSPAHVNALLHPPPSMESPLERRAEAMFPSPVVAEPEDKPAAPVVRSPIDAAASVLERSAMLAPTGKAAMEQPALLAELLYPKPSMDSPLEQAAQSLIPPAPAPVVEAPAPIVSEVLPSSGPTAVPSLAEFLDSPPGPSPLELSAAALERSAVLDPSGKSAMAVPTPVLTLLHPEPSMESPLERTAEAMFSPPVAKAPVGMNGAKREARSPIDAAASVLQRSAELDPSGKAAMVSPTNMASLLYPQPASDSPLERAAQGLIPPAPVAEAPQSDGSVVAPSSGPTFVPTLAQILDAQPTSSPLEAAAALLARSAEEAPTGKAAMDAPPRLRELLSPPPADSPLEAEARRLSCAPRAPPKTPALAGLPDFVAAAMTGKAQPSRSAKAPAEEDKDKKRQVAAPGWRSSVPSAGAAAFVLMVVLGIYMAMSQGVAAVIAAVLPNK